MERLIGDYAKHRAQRKPAKVAASAALNDLIESTIGVRPFSETLARPQPSFETRQRNPPKSAKPVDEDPLAELKRRLDVLRANESR